MSAIPTATLTRVGANSYYISSHLTSIPSRSRECIFGSELDFNDGLVPITLFVLENAKQASDLNLRSTVKSWLKTDDVFNKHFLQHVYFLTNVDLTGYTLSLPEEWKTQSAHTVAVNSDRHLATFRGGPYFASNDGVRQAWRLFDDTNEAFHRCYYDEPSESKPLSGMRIAIKDNIDLKGVRTSAGNRAYQALYAEKEHSGACIERLLEAGAVIVGKTKTVQFASGENARDWFDYSAPFNPRGDGYQEPSGSSTGSATAASAYAWIDATLGTDRRFVRYLEDFLQVKRKKLDVDGLFRRQSIAGGTSLKSYLDTTVAHIQLHDCYQNCQTFVRDYEKEFHKKAFADPYIEYKWYVITAETR
ncbi:hypothetical protein J4E93_009310 [Alternaria ventricosa]|uniref:uncharacterized protein n=1 Tax=Alternaria ventricosa TaxID=1187951 RepID=UPI0020C1E0D9|nr:uncharacterized protein J4E93_009310 [Alternaria ventricosa]KAI4639481.1 hypothetical protein J4E93_009310 [Alternaria ventricosa]